MLTVIINKDQIKDNIVSISEKSDINHIINVYRYKVGDALRLVDGEFEYITTIEKIEKKEVVVIIQEKKEDSYSLNINIDIALGILKNDKMNLAIQKLTEIGIRNIIPTHTERVVVKLDEKKDKWNDISKETLKQCRGVKFTNILEITKLKDIKFDEYDTIIFAYENSENAQNVHKLITENTKNILYIIGPEGGITENEVEYMKSKNAQEISLGKRILRAETAAIVLGGILANVCE